MVWEQAGKAQGARKITDSRVMSEPHALMVEAKARVKTGTPMRT